MSLELLISQEIPLLKPSDTGVHALALMEDNFLRQIPVTDEDDYVALVNENDLLELTTPEMLLSETDLLEFKPLISVSTHPYDAVNTLNQLQLEVLPVTDSDKKYLGSITKSSLVRYLAENTGINAPGGIIVLEVQPRNYTLFEIARICENEDVIITNTSLRTTADGTLEVTLKLNRTIIDAVVASFERHKYVVKEIYGTNRNDEDLTDNYNLLMNYLDM